MNKRVAIEANFPPHDITAERALLSSLMLSGNTAAAVFAPDSGISADMFYDYRHKGVFSAMKAVYANGQPLDIILLKTYCEEKAKDIPVDFLFNLMDEIAHGANWQIYADKVKDRYVRRRVIETANEAIMDAHTWSIKPEETLVNLDKNVYSLMRPSLEKKDKNIKGILRRVVDHITQVKENPVHLIGYSSGLKSLDRITGGIKKAEYSIIAARPSVGKTTLLLNIIKHLTMVENKKVLFFSLEMSSDQVAVNLLSSCVHLTPFIMQTGRIKEEELKNIYEEADKCYTDNLLIEDNSNLTIEDIRVITRHAVRTSNVDVICIDYAQFMKESNTYKDKRWNIDEVSRGCKMLAKDLNLPVTLLSQLNREGEKGRVEGREPKLSDLKESGQFEQDADVVMLLHRDDYEKETGNVSQLQVRVAKNRNGPTGKTKLLYRRDVYDIMDNPSQ